MMGKVRIKSGCFGDEVGTWVSYDDYKKLEAQVKRLQNRLNGAVDPRISELEAQLKEVLKSGTLDGWDLGSAINRLDELEAQLAAVRSRIGDMPNSGSGYDYWKTELQAALNGEGK